MNIWKQTSLMCMRLVIVRSIKIHQFVDDLSNRFGIPAVCWARCWRTSRSASAVLRISFVTSLAAGISPTPLSHEEVTETAAEARDRFTRLLDGLLPRLASWTA